MQSKDILILNRIIFDIYNLKNEHQMREAVTAHIGKIIPCSNVTFFINRSPGVALEDPVGHNVDIQELSKYITEYFYMDETAVFMYTAQSLVFRESQMLDEEKRLQSEYYRELYQRNNLHYSLHINISYQGSFLGVLSLFRETGEPDFSDEDVMLAECLKTHLETVLYQHYHEDVPVSKKVPELLAFARSYQLTLRETDVLERIHSGTRNSQICEELVISPNTLKKYISSIYRKTEVTDRISLMNLIQKYDPSRVS